MTLHDFGFLGPIDREAHGSRPCYRAGCRCTPCRSANAAYEYTRWRSGISRTVSAAQAQIKLQALAGKGIGHRRAAQLAGLAAWTVFKIRHGLTGQIHVETEAAILGLTKPSLAHGCIVDAYDAKRLLLSLLSEDYTPADLAPRLAVQPATIVRLAKRVPKAQHGQVIPRMRVRTVLKLRQLWRAVNGDAAATN